MTLSLLALFMIPVCLACVLNPKHMQRVIKEWGDSPALIFFSTLFLFLFSILIVISTGFNLKFWEDGWSSQTILSWVAVLMALKGLSGFFPGFVSWKVKFATVEKLPMFGFLGLLFWLGMVYLETQVF